MLDPAKQVISRVAGVGGKEVPKKTGKYDINFRQKKLEHIREVLIIEDYILNSTEYVNNRTKLDITCPRGHKWYATWDSIRANKRCKQCYDEGVKKAKMNKRVKPKGWAEHREQMYSKFRSSLAAEGYEIQTDRYVNNRIRVPVKCCRDHDWTVSWGAWSTGERCRYCWIEDSRLTSEQVAQRLAAKGCELLSEYQGCEIPFKYRCECGHISFIRLHDWNAGHRCSRCGGEKARITFRLKRVEKLKHFSNDHLNIKAVRHYNRKEMVCYDETNQSSRSVHPLQPLPKSRRTGFPNEISFTVKSQSSCALAPLE